MIVLDSSAVLAVLRAEPGADFVLERSHGASISTVNYSEVIATVVDRGGTLEEATRNVSRLRLHIAPFTEAQARRAGELRPLTRDYGLSFGDRACLALAEQLGAVALTGDRPWAQLVLGIEVQLIR